MDRYDSPCAGSQKRCNRVDANEFIVPHIRKNRLGADSHYRSDGCDECV